MKQFTKKLTAVGKDLSIIVSSYVIFIVMSVLVFIVLIALILLISDMTNLPFSKKDIYEIVLENQDDLEMIVDDLRSYDMPCVYVNKENTRTYMSLNRMPDGSYMLGPRESNFSTDEELRRFMKKLEIDNIDSSLFDEVEIVTFEVDWMKGFYWVDPDTPTAKACTSDPHDLTPSGDGWEYVYLGKRYYTEKICDQWYFFELTDQPKTKKRKIVVDPA